ncbi:MAG: hypothetical protein U0840_30735 [Gemmataceae bacterium]
MHPELRAVDTPEESRSVTSNILRTWDTFWFTPADPTTLAFMRICCGLLVFYVHLTYSWGLLAYVGPEAWVDKELADHIQRDIPVYSLPWNWSDQTTQVGAGNYYWSVYFHVTDPAWIIGIHVAFVAAPLLFGLGLFTRFTGLVTWLAAMSYVQRASNTVFGLDTMMMIVLAYLNIGPSGATLSLDRWLQVRRAQRRGQPIPEVEPSYAANFAIRMTQIHFCVIYFATGTSKLLGSTWWAGTSLNLVLLNPAFTPLDTRPYYELMKFLATHRLLWEVVMTAGIVYTLVLEIAFPFLVWDRRWRWLLICGSVMLHLNIGLAMGLVTFSLMMMIMVSSFIPPEVMRGLIDDLVDSVTSLWRPSETAQLGKLAISR